VCCAFNDLILHLKNSCFGFSQCLIVQLLFAVSPLLVLAYILLSAWEDPEAEEVKRRKKTDFELDGHAE
jgi:hypothetical protein